MARSSESLVQIHVGIHSFLYSIFLIYRPHSNERIIFRRLNAQTRAMCFEKSPSLLAHLLCKTNVFVEMTAAKWIK